MNSIKLEAVTKLYGEQKALDSVSLSIEGNGVIGLLGPNGAGKTTLMRILTSYMPPTSGTVEVNGYDVQNHSLKVRKKVGYLPENNPLYTDLYVKEYLEMVLRMYGSHVKVNDRVEEMIALTGLAPEYKKKISELSKGYRQRVGLAQALIHNPDILILDEPTSGLDPNQLVDIRKIISRLGESKTVILSTHIMQEVEAVCQRVVIINKGTIVADGPMDHLSHLLSQKSRYLLEIKETIEAEVLQTIAGITSVLREGKQWILESEGGTDLREEIFRFAVAKKWNVLSLVKEEQKMEDIFHRLTEHYQESYGE